MGVLGTEHQAPEALGKKERERLSRSAKRDGGTPLRSQNRAIGRRGGRSQAVCVLRSQGWLASMLALFWGKGRASLRPLCALLAAPEARRRQATP